VNASIPSRSDYEQWIYGNRENYTSNHGSEREGALSMSSIIYRYGGSSFNTWVPTLQREDIHLRSYTTLCV